MAAPFFELINMQGVILSYPLYKDKTNTEMLELSYMQKVILYYKFVPVNDPAMAMRWQRELCRRLELKGRIIVSPQGINGTLGGDIENLRQYKRDMNASGVFRGITYKWSDGGVKEFPRLSVKVKPELVAFRTADEIEVNEKGVVGGGKHLKPEKLHELIKKRGDEVIFFDGRNAYEAAVGKFKNAIVPKTESTRDFVKEIENPKYESLKDKPVVTYCTGGVRCEILSALMKKRGFKEVYQMDGGIVKYGEKYGDEGLWEGALYIFDDRMSHRFSDKSKDIGECVHCGGKTSRYANCSNLACNKLVLICENCGTTKAEEWCKNCERKNSAKPREPARRN